MRGGGREGIGGRGGGARGVRGFTRWLSNPHGPPSGVCTGQRNPQESGRSLRTWGGSGVVGREVRYRVDRGWSGGGKGGCGRRDFLLFLEFPLALSSPCLSRSLYHASTLYPWLEPSQLPHPPPYPPPPPCRLSPIHRGRPELHEESTPVHRAEVREEAPSGGRVGGGWGRGGGGDWAGVRVRVGGG